MSRLPQEWQRLYAVSAPSTGDTASPLLADAQGRVRAAVVELARPADWAALSAVWQGVQADLGLPAAPAQIVTTTGATRGPRLYIN